jgi:hypothetical protein
MTIFFIIFIVFILLGHFGPKYLDKLQKHLEEKNECKREYEDRTLRALERLSDAVPLEEVSPEPSALDNFLKANKKILEKEQVRQAMKNELGID